MLSVGALGRDFTRHFGRDFGRHFGGRFPRGFRPVSGEVSDAASGITSGRSRRTIRTASSRASRCVGDIIPKKATRAAAGLSLFDQASFISAAA